MKVKQSPFVSGFRNVPYSEGVLNRNLLVRVCIRGYTADLEDQIEGALSKVSGHDLRRSTMPKPPSSY